MDSECFFGIRKYKFKAIEKKNIIHKTKYNNLFFFISGNHFHFNQILLIVLYFELKKRLHISSIIVYEFNNFLICSGAVAKWKLQLPLFGGCTFSFIDFNTAKLMRLQVRIFQWSGRSAGVRFHWDGFHPRRSDPDNSRFSETRC